MKVRWASTARQDRAAIWDYLHSRNPDAALRMDSLFSDAAARLGAFPMIGHEGDVAGTRELTPHPSYRLIYELAGDAVMILALVHTARRWPPPT